MLTLSWQWVAGFFDGEGSISLYVRRYSIDIQVLFTQSYKPLLDELRSFLVKEGASLGIRMAIKDKRQSAYSLYVSSNHDVSEVLLRMLPYLRLKHIQAKSTIDYLADRISGDRLVSVFNQEVREGRRHGRIRPLPNHMLPRGDSIQAGRESSHSTERDSSGRWKSKRGDGRSSSQSRSIT